MAIHQLNVDKKQLNEVIKKLKQKYFLHVNEKFKKEFNITNDLACPKITHIVLSKGISNAPGKAIDKEKAVINLGNIAGQKPIEIKAKRSVSQFKISKGRVNGCKVTLRRELMYFFLEKLIECYLVSKRNFYGISIKSFNVQKKNITLSMGIDDERLFPEITSTSSFREGFNVSIVTNATKLEHAKFIMNSIGIPIRSK